jgi:hypothetical protein
MSEPAQNRWEIAPGIFVGQDYYWKRSEGWTSLSGKEDAHWEYWVEISGMNGAGGLWLIEKTRHHGQFSYPNGTPWFSRQPQSLSYEASCKVIQALLANLGRCPHGHVLKDNTCGPCSEGRPNREQQASERDGA